MLRLGLLATGHAAGVRAGDASAFALRYVSAFCRCIGEERLESTRNNNKQTNKKKVSHTSLAGARRVGEKLKKKRRRRGKKLENVKLAGVAAVAVDLAVRRIAHVGIIIMIVNNAPRLMAACEGGEDWLESSGRALDMVMRDGLSN